MLSVLNVITGFALHALIDLENIMENHYQIEKDTCWPHRPDVFGDLLTPTEAAQYLRLDETGLHTPQSAVRILNYWRYRGELKATKFAHRVWYRKAELDRFLAVKTES